MKLSIRIDASTQIGTGHVMRCLTLAKALKSKGAKCHFICRQHEGNLIELIKSNGFNVTALPSGDSFKPGTTASLAHADWLGATQEEDARQTIAVIDKAGQPVDWIVVDHYGIDATWESMIAPHAKRIFVIDDLADRKHACHVLLDQNLGKTKADYAKLVRENSVTLLGPQYALLHPQYSELHLRTPPRQGPLKNIFIYFGGSDPHNVTGMATKACLALNCPEIKLNVVLGNSYAHRPALERLANEYSNFHLHQNLSSLAPLMLEADLAIGAGGSTSWERCAMGLPAIIITIAANQIPIANELHKAQAAVYIAKVENVTESNIEQAVRNWLVRTDAVEWSKRCLAVTDGRGVERVVAAMGVGGALQARLATQSDEELLFEWANDALVRANSFNSEPISAEEHHIWFYRKLQQVNICRIYIIETVAGLPIGQVRFDWDEEKKGWLIDYSVDATMRGQGLGCRILEKAIEELRKDKQGALIFAEVKEQNYVSQKIFTKMNFEKIDILGGVFLFVQMPIVG